MARQHLALILTVLGCAGAIIAEDAAPPAKVPDATSPSPRRPGQGPMAGEFGNVRRALEQLTPEQRQRFIENFKRWSSLPPDEKKALADREGARRQKIAEEIDRVLADAGLNLDGDRRARFVRRYAEERRKVEEQLRRELEEKRQPLLKEIAARLKAEFASEDTAPR